MIIFYNFLLLLIYPMLRFGALFNRRLRANFNLRNALPDFSAGENKLRIWFHASSAGEFEQVRAIARRIRLKNPDVYLAFSFYSDSAWLAKKDDSVPDILFALPFDFPWLMRRLVRRMRPAALIVGKYDAWLNQVRAVQRVGAPIYLASATLPQKSSRYKWPLRNLMAHIYQPMARIFAINEEHAGRLRIISPSNVEVLGDTRFDAIADRLSETSAVSVDLKRATAFAKSGSTLVAGSTYPQSESMLLYSLSQRAQTENRPDRLIVAPHHIHEGRLQDLEAECQRVGLTSARLSNFTRASRDVLIIDRLGLLPYLYGLATVAYIGGGFRGSVHSVIEAAATGVPCVTGPAISNSAEALELFELDLLQVLPQPDAAEFSRVVENLCKNRTVLGKSIQRYFRQRLGVSDKIMHTVVDDILSAEIVKSKKNFTASSLRKIQ
jgi:3-deoxy-D-manno-octulosonic-acid transferase